MERFLQKKKKRDFMGGLALNFWGILKTLFGIFGFFKL
ncbi:membrane protein [Helicobacter pylori]|nr:membrane protein [Helicobacter pylori]